MSTLVRASGLNVTGLLALVAHALTLGLSGAVARDVTDFAAVVALLTLSAVTGHVAEATAGVAGLLTTTGTTRTTETTTVSASAVTTAVVTTLRAVACDVADLSALVALLGTTTAVVAVATLGAFARKVSGLAATVARLLLGRFLAFTAQVTLAIAVIAGRVSLLRAVLGLVRGLAAYQGRALVIKKHIPKKIPPPKSKSGIRLRNRSHQRVSNSNATPASQCNMTYSHF